MKSIARRLRTLAKAVLGKELLIRPEVFCEKERKGSDQIMVDGM